MLFRIFFLLALLLSIAPTANAQLSAGEAKKKARELLSIGRYPEAKAALLSSREAYLNDKEGQFLIAVCNYHLHALDESLSQLLALGDNGRYPFPECQLYLGKIYHARHEFEEAAVRYKHFLSSLPPNNHLRKVVSNEMRRCQNGLLLQYKPSMALVENLGPGINSSEDEFDAIPSPNHPNRCYFSAIRKGNTGGRRDEFGNPADFSGAYYSDIFAAQSTNGQWSLAEPLPTHINTARHEILLDINPIGNSLFFFRGLHPLKGEIFIDSFRDNKYASPIIVPFIGPNNPLAGETSCHLFRDTLLLFASNRPGGYGGYDLYQSTLVRGQWSTPVNLGPQINSAFDETSPFLLRDGRSLFFSSNNSETSIGGFDIFRSNWDPENKTWSTPLNLGLPINSAADESHFRVSADGFTAFLTSSRKDGFGMRDIYIAYFNDFLELEPILSTAPATTPVNNPTGQANPAQAIVATPPATPPVIAIEAPANPTPMTPTPNPPPEPVLFSLLLPRPVPDTLPPALNKAAQYMISNSRVRLSITVFVNKAQVPGIALFQGLKTAEAAVAWLQQQGIDHSRIFIRALPASWSEPDAARQALAMRFLELSDTDTTDYTPLRQLLPAAAYPSAYEAAVLYKVQVASLKGEYRGDLLSKYPDAMVEKSHDLDFYRYSLGAFENYAQADAFRRQLLSQGVSGAYIAAYVHGFRLDRNPARLFTVRYPQLKPFTG
jgi:tetratricopeptide (TPR) repeat protein